jgi:hypothetical protein
LADDAQRIAQESKFVLRDFNKNFGIWTYGTYLGTGPLGVLGNLGQGSANRGVGTAPYRGQDGFHREFWDSLDTSPNPDQVHHFGFHFSAGLSDWASASRYQRRSDERTNNHGDVALTDTSFALGAHLRRNPSQLNRVGQIIRDVICNGNPVPN